jgi:hypothetical protein
MNHEFHYRVHKSPGTYPDPAETCRHTNAIYFSIILGAWVAQ